MPNPKKTPQFHVDCTLETKSRFNKLHEAMNFKTKAETFAAIIYSTTAKDTLDPHLLERLERKLDRVLERYDDLV
jgi:hypothetical protein